MLNFKSFGLPEFLVQALEHLEITQPTPVQEKAIPAAMAGRDVLATAQTGTGKTLAYLLPIISKMKDNSHEQALILAPTRELAEQIKNALVSLLGRKAQHDVALLIGGAPIFKQFAALRKNPRFIVGTPGRIIDHLERGKLTLEGVKYLVLDEMDRMLDMGFSEALEVILQDVPADRQSLLFSATLPPNIAKLSKKYLNKPEHITIGSTTQAAAQVKQEMIKTTAGERFTHLLKELKEREGSVIIFVRTKISADVLAEKLQERDHKADAIHGDLRQRQRESVIRGFRNGLCRIMVATDIAARGLDIPHIKHVINYDLPQSAEDYIHRIGRTGRAGMEGFALSFVLPSEGAKWKAIHRLLNSDPSTAYVGDNQGGGDMDRRRKGGGRSSSFSKRDNSRQRPGRTGTGGKSFGRSERRTDRDSDRPSSGRRERSSEGSSERRTERAPGRTFERRPERASSERTSERRTDRAPGRTSERRPERASSERTSERRTDRAPGRTFERRPERTSERTSERRTERGADRTSERRTTARLSEKTSDRRTSRPSERTSDRRTSSSDRDAPSRTRRADSTKAPKTFEKKKPSKKTHYIPKAKREPSA